MQNLTIIENINKHKKTFILLTIATSLVSIYVTLLWRSKDIAHLGMSVLFFIAVGALFSEKSEQFKIKSSLLAQLIGGLLIGFILINLPLSPKKDVLDPFLRSSPFIFALGLGLIAFGFKGIKQYWRELMILFFLSIPSILLSKLTNPSVITAQFAAFILWCINLDVVREGVYIYLPTAEVEVNKGCSGLEAMTYLLGISIILVIMFPLKRIYNIVMPMIAVGLGFIVNGFRVVIMTLLVASNKMESFKYWHEGEGSLIVGMIAILIFVFLYFLMIRYSNLEHLENRNI